MNLDESVDTVRSTMIDCYTTETLDFLKFVFKFYQSGMICFKLFDRRFTEITSVEGLFNEFDVDLSNRSFVIYIGDRNKNYYSCVIPIDGVNKPGFGNVKINKEIYTIGFSYA